MAYLVSTDDDDVIHATTHGIMSRGDLSFLRERIDSAVRSASGVAARYLNAARDSLARFDFSRLRDNVESMRDRFGRRWDEDRILPLTDLPSLQHAKPTMRQYVMAEPRTRQLYYQNRLDGYGDLYEDDDVGAIGRAHSTYREVMNGSYVDEVEDEDRFVTYLDALDEYGETTLSKTKRDAIRRTWEVQRELLDKGKQDFTSTLRKTL